MKRHRQYVCLLLQVISFIVNCLAEDLILNINLKKPIAVTGHAFLSFTLDPTTLQHNDFIKNIEKSTNLAQSLAPAYIRFGGPQSNFYNFKQVYSHEIDTYPSDMHFGSQWKLLYQWAKNAGLDVIACITPHYIENKSKTDSRDPRNIEELLSFSDRMGYNVSWQMGYECQTRCDLSGGKLGRYVADLHEILKTFPRYANSLITGPDIVEFRTEQQQKYLQDYLHSANSALSAITWHHNLDSISLKNDTISIHYNNTIAEKDELYKIISYAGEKPLWIAESKPQKSEHQYLGALIWTRRLGEVAKLGIQIVMRQLSDLSQATPIYWVSLLHKTLVGREVLKMELQSNNESYVHFYSQCTKPSALYSKGAITIFGMNLTPRKVIASLKDLKVKILHQYILLPDFETGNKMLSEKVLLNNKPLNLINDKKLPDINPEIIINPDGLELELSSGGIGFWIIPNAKVKACTCSGEETVENNIVKKLSKRNENSIQQDNQEEKEENINQLNVIDDEVKEHSPSNLKNRKTYEKQDNRKQKNAENTKTESQQKVWGSKLLARIIKIFQKKLQKINKNESSNLQRSFIIDLGEEQGNLSEEIKLQNLDKKDLTKIDDKFKSIQDTFKKYKCLLLEKKAEMDDGDIQHLKPEIQSIDNTVALISKIDTSLLYKIISNEPITNDIKEKTTNKESIIKIIKKLNEYLIQLENSAEVKTNIIKKIEKYFNKLYSLLEDDSTKNNSQISIHEDLMEGKRFRRHLDRKLENSKKVRILKKRSQIDDFLDEVIKQKIKRKNDEWKKLISSNNINNSKKNLISNKNKYNNLFLRNPVKRFVKSNVFEIANRHTNNQHLAQKHDRIENDKIYRERLKIGEMKKYRSLMQIPKRAKRDTSKKLAEIGLRKDSASRKRSRIDDLKSYINERKMKSKNDLKREGLLVPFNPRTTDSDENNFYGFFRRVPVKGFPKGDIFVTAGDSLEQNDKDYDYVEDEDDSDNGSEKNKQQNTKSMLDHTEDNWIKEADDHHFDHRPNEFFENMKLSNIGIKENSKNYDDLWEAEFSSKELNNNKNNNNKITVAKIIQEQPPNEEKEKHTREINMQQSINYYIDSKERKYDRDALRLASRYPSMSFDHLLKTPTSNINYQASNVDLNTEKSEVESVRTQSKTSNFFYLPSQVSATKYNSNDNYQTSNMNNGKLKEETDFVKDIDSRVDINAKTTQYSRPSVYAEHSIHDNIFHTKRDKRSNFEKLQKMFAEEMIKEDEENAKDYHRRVIRASDLPKALHYRRVKRNISEPTAQFLIKTSSENESTSIDVVQSKENPITREEYEEIMTGDILPSPLIEPNSKESETTTESVITELSTLDYKLRDTTQAIDVTSVLGMDNEQYHNTKKSTTNLFPVESDSELSLNNNDSVKYVTKETFFRAQPSNVQSENKTKTNGSPQVIFKIPSENENNREELAVFVSKPPQKTSSKKLPEFIDKKEKADNSIYSTNTEDPKNEEGYNNDYKIGLKSTNSLKEVTKGIAEQVTTETILSKRATSTAVDDIESNESKTKLKLLQNTEDNQNSESKARIKLGKDADTRRLKIMVQNFPRASLEGLIRYEGHLTRRAEQINKRREKLYARREKLLHECQNELTKITAGQQERNVKRREAGEGLRENDDSRRLSDRKFIGIILDDDITYEDDNESYLIPIKFIPKQYKNIIDRLYLLAKVKKGRHPEHNEFYQFLRNLIEDDGELRETKTFKSLVRKYNHYYRDIPKINEDKKEVKASKFLDREHNQDGQYSSKTMEDERESTETTSGYVDRKVFIIDPSTYYGGEPILQVHEDYIKLPKYFSKIQSQIQDPTPKWIMKDIRHIIDFLTRLRSSQAQHQTINLQDYKEKFPIKDYGQGNTNILYVLDTQRHYDLSKEIWQNLRQLKEAVELNNMHKNLKTDKDYLNSTFALNKKNEFIKGLGNMENKEFDSFDNREKDIMNSETTEDAEKVVKTTTSEYVELTKHEEINKSYNSNENNLNSKMFNSDKTVEHVEKIIQDNPKGVELGKENARSRREVGKRTHERGRDSYFPLTEDRKNKLERIQTRFKTESMKNLYDEQAFLLLTNNRPLNAGLIQRLKNYSVSSSRDFKINQRNEKGHELNYITLIPVNIKDIYEILGAKNNDDSLEHFPAQWGDQYVLGKVPSSMNKYLDDETSEEFEYEDLSNLQSDNSESILDEESYENKRRVSVEDNQAELEKDEQYRITNDEIDKYLKMKKQVGSNDHGMFLLFPWRNVKERQRRHIKSEINEDTAKIKHEVTRQSQPNKSMMAKNLANKRTKRHYLNNNIDKDEENMIETNDIRANYLQPQTNRKNHDDLLEDFIKARKKNNLYNKKASYIRNEEMNEITPLNSISKSDKKLLQEEIPKLQNHIESMKEFANDSEENFSDTVASDEDIYHRNRTSETTGNAFHTAIMNIKDFFAFFSKISRIFMH